MGAALYLPYNFKKILCGPGPQQQNVPEHQNEPPTIVCARKVAKLPQWRALVRVTKLQYLAHKGVWTWVLRGPVESVNSSTGTEVPI